MVYITSYKELIVWQKSIKLVKEIFVLTEGFPQSELYGLISQLRRAAVSIPSNIAEGYGRRSTKDYTKFYTIAYGSALEVETQIIIAKELRFGKKENYLIVESLLQEVCRMLNKMITKMKELDVK